MPTMTGMTTRAIKMMPSIIPNDALLKASVSFAARTEAGDERHSTSDQQEE
jgi:hypothetical protein